MRLQPSWSMILTGAVVAIVVPTALGLLWAWAVGVYGFAFAPVWVYWLPYGGLAAFVIGWHVGWSGLRPHESMLRGALLGVILYFGVGLLWVFAFNVSRGAPVLGLIHGGTLLLAAIWPLQIAQMLGLFGLTIR